MNKIRQVWYDILDAWDDFPVLRWVVIGAFVLALVLAVTTARAVEPGWYAPLDGSGQGVIVRCNADECAANWLTYLDGEQIWMQTVENCKRGEVCEARFARTAGSWFGRDSEFGPVEVTADLEPTADSLIVDYNAIALFPEACNTGSGGLLLRNCIGVREFFLLAE